MGQLSLLVPAPRLVLILLLNIVILVFIIALFIVIIYIKKRPFCVTPTELDLTSASNLRTRKGSTGKVIPNTQRNVKIGFSFKDRGDDIGTDMSEEEAPIKPVDEATATAFDPKLVANNLRTAEQQADDLQPTKDEPTQKQETQEFDLTQGLGGPDKQNSKKSEFESTQRL